MPESSLPSLAILGTGRVGGSILRAALGAGIDARGAGREQAPAALAEATAALLCVPDSEIESAAELAARSVPPLRLVGHTSGATSLEALARCRERGASTFSLHPLQTVPDPATDLRGAPCAIAGSDPAAEDFARALASALGMHPFSVPDEARSAYHAAASIASNFLVTLEQSATELLERAGVEQARELLTPLVLRSAANWAERGGEALTGPIARGDADTVARQRQAVAERAPELLALYDALAERTAAVARTNRAPEVGS